MVVRVRYRVWGREETKNPPACIFSVLNWAWDWESAAEKECGYGLWFPLGIAAELTTRRNTGDKVDPSKRKTPLDLERTSGKSSKQPDWHQVWAAVHIMHYVIRSRPFVKGHKQICVLHFVVIFQCWTVRNVANYKYFTEKYNVYLLPQCGIWKDICLGDDVL